MSRTILPNTCLPYDDVGVGVSVSDITVMSLSVISGGAVSVHPPHKARAVSVRIRQHDAIVWD